MLEPWAESPGAIAWEVGRKGKGEKYTPDPLVRPPYLSITHLVGAQLKPAWKDRGYIPWPAMQPGRMAREGEWGPWRLPRTFPSLHHCLPAMGPALSHPNAQSMGQIWAWKNQGGARPQSPGSYLWGDGMDGVSLVCNLQAPIASGLPMAPLASETSPSFLSRL